MIASALLKLKVSPDPAWLAAFTEVFARHAAAGAAAGAAAATAAAQQQPSVYGRQRRQRGQYEAGSSHSSSSRQEHVARAFIGGAAGSVGGRSLSSYVWALGQLAALGPARGEVRCALFDLYIDLLRIIVPPGLTCLLSAAPCHWCRPL
jgi:hypothetical protein